MRIGKWEVAPREHRGAVARRMAGGLAYVALVAVGWFTSEANRTGAWAELGSAVASVDWQQWLAVGMGLGNAASMLLAILGKPWAWLVVIVGQSVNLTYLGVTDQWEVWIGGQPVCLALGFYGLWRWLTKGVHRDPARKGVRDGAQA